MRGAITDRPLGTDAPAPHVKTEAAETHVRGLRLSSPRRSIPRVVAVEHGRDLGDAAFAHRAPAALAGAAEGWEKAKTPSVGPAKHSVVAGRWPPHVGIWTSDAGKDRSDEAGDDKGGRA